MHIWITHVDGATTGMTRCGDESRSSGQSRLIFAINSKKMIRNNKKISTTAQNGDRDITLERNTKCQCGGRITMQICLLITKISLLRSRVVVYQEHFF